MRATTTPLFFLSASAVWAKPEFATKGAGILEKFYVGDCKADKTPHGFYGAFLQPCEFSFYKAESVAEDIGACQDMSSELVGTPIPVHWFFNVTEHMTKDDWDKISSDDLPSAEELMLWPDQCVGVGPRCYTVDNEAIEATLFRLFADGEKIPAEATHVQVDCRGDALALSRLTYAFADGFAKSTPTIVAWIITVLVFGFVATIGCVYGCFRVYRETKSSKHNFTAVAMPYHNYKTLAESDVGAGYEACALQEKSRLV